MKIYVCVKHVPDSAVTINVVEKTNIDEGINFILNPYDENALTEAVKLKQQIGEAKIIAVTVGKPGAEETIRSAMAMGADEGIHILTEEYPDSILTAKALKAAIQNYGEPGIIFAGKESIDYEGSQTMFRLGKAFNYPVATNVISFRYAADKATVECATEANSRDVLELKLPCVIGAAKGLNKPAYPTVKQIILSKKKPIQSVRLEELSIESKNSKIEIIELKPMIDNRKQEEIKGSNEAIADRIVEILKKEAKVI